MSQMPPPPPPPPPPSGTDTSTDRQTGTVKPSSSRAMEAWTLWDKLKYAARKAWLALLAKVRK